jgi:hypothetical protein
MNGNIRRRENEQQLMDENTAHGYGFQRWLRTVAIVISLKVGESRFVEMDGSDEELIFEGQKESLEVALHGSEADGRGERDHVEGQREQGLLKSNSGLDSNAVQRVDIVGHVIVRLIDRPQVVVQVVDASLETFRLHPKRVVLMRAHLWIQRKQQRSGCGRLQELGVK